MNEEYYFFVRDEPVPAEDVRIIIQWYEDHGVGYELLSDPVLEGVEIGPVLDFIATTFPQGWEIINGKVVGIDPPKGRAYDIVDFLKDRGEL